MYLWVVQSQVHAWGGIYILLIVKKPQSHMANDMIIRKAKELRIVSLPPTSKKYWVVLQKGDICLYFKGTASAVIRKTDYREAKHIC